jgi:hypothetical protein
VRYLPELWHEIESGSLDHVRALLDYYVAIFDNVVPIIALERLTHHRVLAVQPGSLHAPS